MPKIEQTIADVNVRRHTFAFIPPKMTDEFKIPNSVQHRHTDKSTRGPARRCVDVHRVAVAGGLATRLTLHAAGNWHCMVHGD